MSKLYQVSNEEKERIRNLHLNESNNKKISSILNEQVDGSDAKSMDAGESGSGGVKAKMSGPQMQMSNAGDYHMWSNCAGGGTVALFDNQTTTANGQSCHNAVNQGIPGLVLACNQALVNAFGTGPVLSWGIGSQHRSCWEYQGTQFFNNTPNAVSPGTGGGYTVPQTLPNCSSCGGNQGDLAWMCTDVGGGQGGTGCQQVACPYPTIQNMPGKCWDNQQDCNNGGLNPSINAQPCGGYSTDEHECLNGQCVPWAGGSFQTLQDCQTNCGTTYHCINCDLQIMSTYQSGGACPQGFVDVGTSVPVAGPCVECLNNNCQGTGNNGWAASSTPGSTFNSIPDCQNSQQCSGGGTDYECVGGQCLQQNGGQFANAAACQASGCGTQYPNYKCSGAGGCVQNPNGTYGGANGLVDCEIACCQTSMSNWNWNGLPNPTCQQLTAKFNTPALQAIGDCAGNLTGNVPYNFNHKCRYDWMVAQAASLGCPCSGANTACCSDPGFAVGFATADPLGCFNQALKTNSENANVQGYGCQWFCNVLANKHNAYAGTQSPVAQCKHMGGIQFLTDYMTTAQSNFISGPASFTGPCPNIPTGPSQNNIC